MKLQPIYVLVPWSLCGLFKGVAAAAIVRSCALRRWPFLFAQLTFESLRTAFLFGLHLSHRPNLYRDLYWYTQPLIGFLEAFVVRDVLSQIPGYELLPSIFRRSTFWIAVSIGVIVFLLCLHEPNEVRGVPWDIVNLRLQRCTTAAWLGCLVVLLSRPSFIGMGWTLDGIVVASGALVTAIANACESWAESVWPWRQPVWHNAEVFTTLAVLSVWILYFTAPTLSREVTRQALRPIRNFLPTCYQPAEKDQLV